MRIEDFYSIIRFIFYVLFQGVLFIYNIPITDNVKFGPLAIIIILIMILLYTIFKPFRKD